MGKKLNLTIEQGADFSHRLIWKDANKVPIDLTNYDARLQIRSKIDSPNFLIELTVANGQISLGGVNGTIDLKIDAITTTGLNWTTAVYDLELISGTGFVTRLIEGNMRLSHEVTR